MSSTTKYDLTNAASVVAEYIAALNDPNRMPARTAARSFIEPVLEKHGVIRSVRELRFMEAHAIWYACLVVTGNVRRVSRLEKSLMRVRDGRSTEKTIKMLRTRKGIAGNSIAAVHLNEILESVGHEVAA